jgi:hypothetical protein
MSGMNWLTRLIVVAVLVVTIAGTAIATAYTPVLGTASNAGVQVADKGNSDGQETHG